jgi:hypothetical protein
MLSSTCCQYFKGVGFVMAFWAPGFGDESWLSFFGPVFGLNFDAICQLHWVSVYWYGFYHGRCGRC